MRRCADCGAWGAIRHTARIAIPQSRDAPHSRPPEDEYMTNASDTRPYKESQLFDWAMEPAEERPSEFSRPSGFSARSGYREVHRKREPNHLFLAGAVVLATGSVALYGLAQLLRG